MKHKGFTLIELLVAVAVIAILLGLTSSALLSGVVAARAQSHREQCRQIAIAMGAYVQDEGDFVPSVAGYSTNLNRALSPVLGPRWYWQLGQQRGWVYRMETRGVGRYRMFTVTCTGPRGITGYTVDRSGNVAIIQPERDSQPPIVVGGR